MSVNVRSGFKWVAKLLLFSVPVAIGVMVFSNFMNEPKAIRSRKKVGQIKTVRVLNIKPQNVTPEATGFGVVRPTRFWKAVSEVSGKVDYINPNLKVGSFLKKGTVLVKLDRTTYRLSVTEAQETIKSIDAQIEELKVRQSNYQSLLDLEKRRYELAQNEMKRQDRLYKGKYISSSIYEEKKRSLLSQENQVISIRNNLNLIPPQLQRLESQKAQSKIRLEESRLKLKNTVIKTPYAIRVTAVNVDTAQYVGAGLVIAQGDGIDTVEIEAHFSSDSLRPLFMNGIKRKRNHSPGSFGRNLNLSATVRFQIGNQWKSRKGTITRISDTIDPQTKTIGLIVEVKDPYKERPPMVKGLYCEIFIQGKAVPNQLVIPRSALHENNTVYTLNDESRLVKQQIKIDFFQNELAILKSGLQEGETLILSDVVPAIEGMLLQTVDAAANQKRMGKKPGNQNRFQGRPDSEKQDGSKWKNRQRSENSQDASNNWRKNRRGAENGQDGENWRKNRKRSENTDRNEN